MTAMDMTISFPYFWERKRFFSDFVHAFVCSLRYGIQYGIQYSLRYGIQYV
jgi:hypothetical protein